MNKPMFCDGRVHRVLRSIAALAVLFFAVGIGQANAQGIQPAADSDIGYNVRATASQTSAQSFLDPNVALANVTAAIKDPSLYSATTPQQEVEHSVLVEYYTVAAEQLQTGVATDIAVGMANASLTDILNRFDATFRPARASLESSLLTLTTP